MENAEPNPLVFTPKCHTCNQQMVDGELKDRGHNNHESTAVWTDRRGPSFKLRGYRCPQCGLVQIYAK